jgi:hypothetical protein
MIGLAIFLVVGAVAILKIGGWAIDCLADIEAMEQDGWQ